MGDGGILLALPTQSVAIRLVLGAVIAFAVVRWVLHANLRSVRVRVAAALVPAGVLVTIVVASLADPRLPTLMLPADGSGPVLPVQLDNDYTYLAPIAVSVLVGAWAIVASGRMLLRIVRVARANRRARRDVAAGTLPGDLAWTVGRLAGDFGVRVPRAALTTCPGGAMLVGIRHPVLLLDAAFVGRLDDEEVEGVIAHELAHLARRDNLIALLFGLARDLVFFMPGGNWAVRRLLVERELAADLAAIERTRRPGALAAGLVKVLDMTSGHHGTAEAACASLMPAGTLTTRVEALCDDRPPPGPVRHTAEALALVTTFVALVVVSTLVPRLVAGDDPEDALALYVAGSAPVPDVGTPAVAPPARAFATYHASPDRGSQDPSTVPAPGRALDTPAAEEPARADLVDAPDNLSAGMLRACTTDATCGLVEPTATTLELQPRTVLVQADIEVKWRARQIAHSGDLRVFRLSSRG